MDSDPREGVPVHTFRPAPPPSRKSASRAVLLVLLGVAGAGALVAALLAVFA
jgi:hypothetical protein